MSSREKPPATEELHFDVSTGLKRVLGRELITDHEVAIFEMVKNSFDAGADTVHIHFENDSVIVADNGTGMSYDDLNNKWLFVAYSAKRNEESSDFRQQAADRHVAGSKGIGRFSSDRLGEELTLQTIAKGAPSIVHRLDINWQRFEKDDKEHFEDIPVTYKAARDFEVPKTLQRFASSLRSGTVIELRKLRNKWNRAELLALKSSLAKLINPFGAETDSFNIYISAPAELAEDKRVGKQAAQEEEEPLAREIVNGRVGNFIFADLQEKTTFIQVSIVNGYLDTTLTDRGEVVYKIREPNPYRHLGNSGFKCEIYYLNRSSKLTFARRVGLPSVNFGSVFLFRNGFRVYPIGEVTDDWFGFDRRKQQGYNRFLGTRDVIGRVDVYGSETEFQEASSRNQGLIENAAVKELNKAVMEHGLKRLEKYVVPVSWADKGEADSSDLSRLLNDPGRARVVAAVANLVDRDDVELQEYSTRLIGLLNERSEEFESSIVNLRSIAEKTGDKSFIDKIEKAEKRFEALRKSEAEARKIADRERTVAAQATDRAVRAEAEIETERRRSLFLESVVSLDVATILNLHHQVTIYAVDIGQQIENLLASTQGQKQVPREAVLVALEQMAFLNRKVLAVTKFAAKANFKLESEKINANLPEFITEYITNVAKAAVSSRIRIDVSNDHAGMRLRFNPMDVSIIIDNLVSNARKAKASRISFQISSLDKDSVTIRVADNGQGLARGVDPARIFEMGYTTTRGSGLGLYHVRQVLGQMGGSIELDESNKAQGVSFIIKIVGEKRSK
ncbi:MAG: sensor histidine kinase [Methylovirgula sp.]|uniref:sensor histidine kinase n=1 Tax=Methylovirgula sp. TaxID=1978224 RepID=UPI0030761D33